MGFPVLDLSKMHIVTYNGDETDGVQFTIKTLTNSERFRIVEDADKAQGLHAVWQTWLQAFIMLVVNVQGLRDAHGAPVRAPSPITREWVDGTLPAAVVRDIVKRGLALNTLDIETEKNSGAQSGLQMP